MFGILSKIKSYFKKNNGVSKIALSRFKRAEAKSSPMTGNQSLEIAIAAYEGLRIYDSHLDQNFENPPLDSYDISFPSPVD
jgi:hypothetical protein